MQASPGKVVALVLFDVFIFIIYLAMGFFYPCTPTNCPTELLRTLLLITMVVLTVALAASIISFISASRQRYKWRDVRE